MTASGRADPAELLGDHVRFVLVEPQHPGNVGAAARAMRNMGLDQLVIVAPPAWDPETARWMAPGCDDLLDRIRVVATLDEALEGVHLAIASTARHRKQGALLGNAAEQFGPLHGLETRGAQCHEQGEIGWNGRRPDDGPPRGVALGHVLPQGGGHARAVAAVVHVHAFGRQASCQVRRGAVVSRHLRAIGVEATGEGAHADAADAEEIDVAAHDRQSFRM